MIWFSNFAQKNIKTQSYAESVILLITKTVNKITQIACVIFVYLIILTKIS
jgi:hypothetical protein